MAWFEKRMHVLFALAAVVLLASAQEPDPPSKKEQEQLARRYFELDGKTREGREEQLAILEQLERVPELSAKEADRWRETLLKLQSKGRKLEKKSGRHYFWEKPERRGLYLVGGKTSRPKGLFVGFHGGGSGSGDANEASSNWSSAASKMGWVAIFPQVLEKTDRGWTTSGTEEFVIDLIDAALRTWDIDRDKIFFGGHSMGGYGTWTLGGRHADRVAGLTPSAGGPTIILSGGEVTDIVDGIVPNLRGVCVRIYQSDDDVQVPPEANRMAARRLAEAQERWGGYDYEYWEVPRRGHDLPPGGTKALLEKVRDAERDHRPPELTWQPTIEWKRQYYWLHWENPVPVSLVEASIDREQNAIAIQCTADPAGLSVLVDDVLVDLDRELVVTLAGAEVYRGQPARSLSTLVLTAARNDPALLFDARIPVGE